MKIQKSRLLRNLPLIGLFLLGGALFPLVWMGELRSIPVEPKPTALYEDRRGAFLAEISGEEELMGFWPVGVEISEKMINALIAVEDKRFFRHPGVDLHALARSLWNNLLGREIQGASTLAMQVIRLQHPAPRTLGNKLVEMTAAVLMTQRYGRETVLRQYLRLMPQGGPYYGAAYSARRFFDKPLEDLSWAEAALLAALPRDPSKMNLFSRAGMARARQRAFLIARRLEDQNYIDAEEASLMRDQLALFEPVIRETRELSTLAFLQAVAEEGLSSPAGSPIRTSLDRNLQRSLLMAVEEGLPEWRDQEVGNLALIVARIDTGEILAYLGSADYQDEQHKGAINYARVLRSSGSTLKPFFFALGLETGIFSPASILPDLPLNLMDPTGLFSVENYDEGYLGPMLYRRALANSRNTPAIRLVENLGIVRCFDQLERLGLTDGEHNAAYYGYGMAVGGIYVRLEDLMQAYGVLASDGRDFKYRWLAATEESEPGSSQAVFSTSVARQIGLFLSDPAARLPSFPRLGALEFPYPVAVKTGTSQGFRDAWTAAYSSDYLVGVWMGEADNRTMNHFSGSDAAALVQKTFDLLYAEVEPEEGSRDFPIPEPYQPVQLCALSGELAGEHCSESVTEYFLPGTEPQNSCSVHRLFAVDRRTGGPADENTPPDAMQLQVYPVFPPEYQLWAAQNGIGLPGTGENYSSPQRVKLSVQFPLEGSRFILDPGMPARFQTLALRATIEPEVPELIWQIDGEEAFRAAPPYEVRWPLEEGRHTVSVRLPGASVASDPVPFEVIPY